MFGFAFPLFGQQMFNALGEGKGNTVRSPFSIQKNMKPWFMNVQLLACVAIVLGIPFPIWIYYKGEAIRSKNPLSNGSM